MDCLGQVLALALAQNFQLLNLQLQHVIAKTNYGASITITLTQNLIKNTIICNCNLRGTITIKITITPSKCK